MKLSEVPFKDIKIGMRVLSDSSTCGGKVVDKRTQAEANDREGDLVYIDWDNGNRSYNTWHFWCDKVTVVEENNNDQFF